MHLFLPPCFVSTPLPLACTHSSGSSFKLPPPKCSELKTIKSVYVMQFNSECFSFSLRRFRTKTNEARRDWKKLQKRKLVPVHIMKAYRGRKGIAPLILNLGNWWIWVLSFTPRPLYRYRLNCRLATMTCIKNVNEFGRTWNEGGCGTLSDNSRYLSVGWGKRWTTLLRQQVKGQDSKRGSVHVRNVLHGPCHTSGG
jgi:hypothetical protein